MSGQLIDMVFHNIGSSVQTSRAWFKSPGKNCCREPRAAAAPIGVWTTVSDGRVWCFCFTVDLGVSFLVLSCLVLAKVLRPLLYQLDMSLLERLVDKLRVQPADEVIEDTVDFIRDMAEATQQVRPRCSPQV